MKNSNLLAAAIVAIFSTQIFAATVVSVPSNQNPIEVVEEDFVEVETAKLPEAVIEAVNTDHTGSTISKAFVNKEGIYKLVLTHDDKESTVYANAEGKWVEL